MPDIDFDEDVEVLESLGPDMTQAALLYARERRTERLGDLRMARTHFFRGVTEMKLDEIDLNVSLPVRNTPTTFRTKIRINDTGSVSNQHRGLVFELGGSSIGTAIWVEDGLIGFAAGKAAAANQATGTFSFGSEIPVGLTLTLVLAVNPANGLALMWGNGKLLSRVQATSPDGFDTTWAGTGPGSFATAVNVTTLATVIETGAPDGFDVIEALSVYLSQVPREFH